MRSMSPVCKLDTIRWKAAKFFLLSAIVLDLNMTTGLTFSFTDANNFFLYWLTIMACNDRSIGFRSLTIAATCFENPCRQNSESGYSKITLLSYLLAMFTSLKSIVAVYSNSTLGFFPLSCWKIRITVVSQSRVSSSAYLLKAGSPKSNAGPDEWPFLVELFRWWASSAMMTTGSFAKSSILTLFSFTL